MDDPDGELTISGVVYNEMKGAFSSPEGVLDRVILNSFSRIPPMQMNPAGIRK